MGIAARDISRLFQDFHQLGGGLAEEVQGTGLGLALTKRLVEAQGGKVGVVSQSGKGSRFYADLPCSAEWIQTDLRRLQQVADTSTAANSAAAYAEAEPQAAGAS
jgi:signal transduction histidine kinase